VCYLRLFAALIFVLTLSAPAARAADEMVMGPPWPPPASMTAEDIPLTSAIPPDYPEDFSQPDTPVRTAVHNAFGEDETKSVSSSTISPDAAILKP